MGSSSSSRSGCGEQGGRERHAHAPAAGELRHRTGKVVVGETKSAQDFRSPGRSAVGVDLDQPLVDVGKLFGLGDFQLRVQAARSTSAARIVSNRLTGVAGCS